MSRVGCWGISLIGGVLDQDLTRSRSMLAPEYALRTWRDPQCNGVTHGS